jgi:putative cell wall-binding protein
MSPVTVVIFLLAAVVAFVVAFRLDELRNATGRGLWRLTVERLTGRVSRGRPRRMAHQRRWARSVATLVPLALLAGVLATGMWWVGTNRASTSSAQSSADRDREPAGAEPASAASAVADGSGATATDVAVALSRQVYPDGDADNVLLTRQAPSVDALVAGGLQGLLDGPLLLTTPDTLPPETAAEIDRLGTPSVHILGGEQAVSAAIQDQLAASGHDVHRHAGPTGVETAIDIATRHFSDAEAAIIAPAFGADTDSNEVLARSLTAGGLAAALEVPVLVSAAGSLSPSTADYVTRSGIGEILVIGSQGEIGSAVMDDLAALGVAATRLAGEDRYATAVRVSGADVFGSGAGNDALLLAEGSGETMWPGASIAAIYAGRENAPIVLSSGAGLPEATRAYLATQSAADTSLRCMPGVVEAACAEARAILAGE